MIHSDPALRQEWTVFCALAPQELLDLIISKDLSVDMRSTIETIFIQLGFFELSLYWCHKKGANKLFQPHKDYDTRELLHLFMDNIKSESLYDLFDKQVGYYY